MDTSSRSDNPPEERGLLGLWRSLASLKLAVALIGVLATVLAVATFIEAKYGTEFALWYVYYSAWFVALLGLLSLNILAATLIRFPWKSRQIAFVITHVGLLLLLAGSIQTFTSGIEGQMHIAEGKEASRILIRHRTLLQIIKGNNHDHGPGNTDFLFSPGPVDWPTGKTLDFGESEGIGVKVLRFRRHTDARVAWVADETPSARPALRFALAGPSGEILSEDWLVGEQFGARMWFGPPLFKLFEAPADSMHQDFLGLPETELGERGVLSVHYQGQVERIAVDGNLKKRVPIGSGGVEVEILEYVPDAEPGDAGRFVSRSDQPNNPLVDLRVYLPDREEPIRQIALAKMPLLNLDAIPGRECPVKFWYHHHPAIQAAEGAAFLQTPNGKLYARKGARGKPEAEAVGEVKPGDTFDLTPEVNVLILDHVPHARRQIEFPSSQFSKTTEHLEAAALVEVAAGGTTHKVWLRRMDPEHGVQTLQTPDGPLTLTFGYDDLDAGFALKLIDFEPGKNPGGMGFASYASEVELIDEEESLHEEHRIWMNHPLTHRKFSFYQSSYQRQHDGTYVSVLSVAYDPGRLLKYLGSLMICAGILAMFYGTARRSILRGNR